LEAKLDRLEAKVDQEGGPIQKLEAKLDRLEAKVDHLINPNPTGAQ
jgi:outer membrane murein-binding lipoprotein Lpp